MRKLISLILACTILLMSTVTFAESAIPTSSIIDLSVGTVTVYDFGATKLHSYASGDALGDECYAIESEEGIVLLESTAFTANNEAWKAYIGGLNKPISGALMAYHPNGANAYGDMTIYATENALKNWGEDGNIRALTENFVAIFGDVIQTDLPTNAEIVKAGETVKLAGLDFIIREEGDDAYGVEIPAINSVYLHMMGSDVHSILSSTTHIDERIKELQAFDYELVLTSHYTPEDEDAVKTKIAYLEKVKELAASSTDATSFTEAMNTAFPNYSGANYLEMTAGFLFPAAH